MSPAQFSKVEILFNGNEDLFAASIYELGRTHVVKHKMNTALVLSNKRLDESLFIYLKKLKSKSIKWLKKGLMNHL